MPKCDECTQNVNSVWKATDDFGETFFVCGECIEADANLYLMRGDGR